ncbi:type III-B CRISPR-associated protein Cas10/Cmr2 [Thermus sp.]|uniref:type III-B CRISPR-associated protein Cas10/Cmr2 n=1 Tax=Thermus sp. TaxID=275 RepID=UPI00307E72D0
MAHLLALALGPVQDFIATARRTRDLFAGSRLLSEAAGAAARRLVDRLGEENLIFPAPQGDLNRLAQSGIPNVLLAVVREGDPGALAEEALEAARGWLKAKAEELLGPHRAHLDWEAVLAQVEDLLEGYWAFLPLGDYPRTRRRLMALLAARKNTRDFAPWRGKPRPKSSLDGGREGVLKEGFPAARLGVRPGEVLSGPDLLKRLWPAQGFLSTLHLAALPWALGLGEKGAELEAFLQDLHGLPGEFQTARHPALKDTPLQGRDVRLLFPERLHEVFQGEALGEALRLGGEMARALGRPHPYYALLHADGDRMGEALDGLESPEAHRAFSRALALGFAAQVRAVVEEEGRGGLVYAGGDDVLALLPLHTALRVVARLRDLFQEALEGVEGLGVRPTLSVGLAVVHALDPLQDALDLVRRAERMAKEKVGRDALYVVYSPRAGSELEAYGRFDQDPRLTRRLLRLVELYRLDALPSKVGYELWRLLQEGKGLPEEALLAEARRILLRKDIPRAYRQELLARLEPPGDLETLANELLVARAFLPGYALARVPLEDWEVYRAH